jgi:hypothetical protein
MILATDAYDGSYSYDYPSQKRSIHSQCITPLFTTSTVVLDFETHFLFAGSGKKKHNPAQITHTREVSVHDGTGRLNAGRPRPEEGDFMLEGERGSAVA